MATSIPPGDREKVVSKLPVWLRQDLKVRAAELGVDIQDAVSDGIERWRSETDQSATLETAGSVTFSTWLKPGQWEGLQDACRGRGIPYVQGLAQAVCLWLAEHPSPRHRPLPRTVRRIVVCNQKGGVGKTAITSGLAQTLAEGADSVRRANEVIQAALQDNPEMLNAFEAHELRVLMVDYDPQGHLTKQLGFQQLPPKADSLAKFMAGGQNCRGTIEDLLEPVSPEEFGGRLDLLPSCADAFLLDISIVMDRNRQATLERALKPLESRYDVILIDCPPSLGLAMDAAIYYSRRRDGEAEGNSGCVIVVQAEDSSADAYTMLTEQIGSGMQDWAVDVDLLGLVVNLYDGRRGYIATSSLKSWQDIGHPRVVGIVPDLKEQREAVRRKMPLFLYAPHSDQARAIRSIAREIS
ncbi:ParA family protein [Streptomyces xanthophaeus]|uniref:ParA family protein n=1 Tax=Streptomyces xanthophaeus TaxID=67385 RepID=UPI003710D379